MNSSIQLKKATPQFIVAFALLLRPVCKGHALSILVLVLASLVGRREIYAVNSSDTFYGLGALSNVTTGISDSAFGYYALGYDTTGSSNTATGYLALEFNTTGNLNTAIGASALNRNETAPGNTATGAYALFANNSGTYNTADGSFALAENNFGYYNTATGAFALNRNTIGFSNVAVGYSALYSNTAGNYNTANGFQALKLNSFGAGNTANGFHALYSNTTGAGNTANGLFALTHNTTGNYNTAAGNSALDNNTTGGRNIAIGLAAGTNLTTGNGNIDIGNAGVAAESNTIRIGTSQTRAFLAGVRNAVAVGGVAVYAAANGQLGTNPSSEHFKRDIADMDKQSEAILALRPVSFHYKKELDPKQSAQFGLIAEEVEKVNPDLVVRDKEGRPYTVRYEQLNAMLLNEFLKEHRKTEKLEATVVRQQKQIDALTAIVQKVSAQLQVSKPAPQTVQNNQ